LNKALENLLSCGMEADFFIVGQGLAGSLLAFELLKRNKTVLVFDDPQQPKASEVAAGIINPVVFRRMTKSWLVDDAFPVMEDTYWRLEKLLNQQFYFPAPMVRILSEDAVLLWKDAAIANQLHAYLLPQPLLDSPVKGCDKTFSFGLINKSGRLDIQKFIHLFKEFLNNQNLLVAETFDFKKINFETNNIRYDNLTAQKVVFCEGPAVSANPFFENLRFKHSKGEILDLEIQEFYSDKIINDEVFVMPMGQNRYKVGATYSWDTLNWEPTSNAQEELQSKLHRITTSPYRTLAQKAGIRPTMHDRKPVLGLLSDRPQVGILNGLGSKGVLWAPYLARQLADLLTNKSDFIHPEVNISRYYKQKHEKNK